MFFPPRPVSYITDFQFSQYFAHAVANPDLLLVQPDDEQCEPISADCVNIDPAPLANTTLV